MASSQNALKFLGSKAAREEQARTMVNALADALASSSQYDGIADSNQYDGIADSNQYDGIADSNQYDGITNSNQSADKKALAQFWRKVLHHGFKFASNYFG